MMSGKKLMNSIIVGIVVVCVLNCSSSALAASYTVGDEYGWDFNVEGWGKGKNFTAGDILVFKYSTVDHNVVLVDKSNYNSCDVPPNAKTYSSGYDKIALVKGPNYFICGTPGHCDSGMKIAANAAYVSS